MTIAVSSVFAERAFRRPMAADVRRRLDEDISIVFRMLNRSDWVREFILGSSVSSDLLMLMSPLGAQSSFILETEEHQEGRLTGSIKMRYLVVPSFTTPEGLSGGAVVTTYARRDHPLHAPNVMATTRIGRYVRDNDTGEWLFLTRNETDNVTRMQWLHSSKSTTRERICLTCNSTLFNKGRFADSILFECHDEEWRPCPQCHAPPEACCSCSTSESALVLPKHPLDLPSVAAAALAEPKSEWFGRVQVSILSNLTKELRGDVDACMNLRTSFAASQDAALALQMQNLALAERAKSVIPKHVSPPKLLTNGHATGAASAFGVHSTGFVNVLHNSEDNQSVPHSPVLNGQCSDMPHSSTGLFPQFMSEMMNGRDEKHFSLDSVIPELISRAEKKVAQEAHPHAQSTDGRSLPVYTQQVASNAAAFDPMSLLMAKHSAAGDSVNPPAPGCRNSPIQPVPASHSPFNNSHHQHQEKQQLQDNHEHQHLVVNSLSGSQDQDTAMLHRLQDFSQGAPAQHGQGHQSPSPHQSHLTRGPVDGEGDDEEDDEGVFDTNAGRQRMSTTKSFETLLGTFMGPHGTSSGVDITSLDNMDIVGSPWINGGPSPTSVLKHNPSLPPQGAQGHFMAQSMPNRVVAPAPQPPNPFPPHHASNGIHQRTSPLDMNQSNPITTAGVPLKCEHRVFSGSFNGNGAENLSTDALDADESGQSLARLQPRPPGMSACADRAWMWHMGPRGPFGVAAIAAARERERRAEERRRKNREAAARSNARAKERLERIKGELEKNKDRISRLSRKRRELELQNNTLKQRLEQQAS